jgi:formylglycine-generating enzyme required for sulfatase activity
VNYNVLTGAFMNLAARTQANCRTAYCVILALCVCAASVQAAQPASSREGIVAEAPAGVRAVKIDGGYMVPYVETIPGTEVKFEMVPIPGGEFLMGSPADEPGRSDDEGPQVRVRVEPFWIGKCEVSWAEYHAFMDMYLGFKELQIATVKVAKEGDAALSANDLKLVQTHTENDKLEADWGVDAVTVPTPLYQPDFTYATGNEPDQPAVTMTPYAARQYTKWLSRILVDEFRLPTEAEWEYAARAGTTTAWSFGNDPSQLKDYAWYKDNGEGKLHAVGGKKPNPWGLHDMHGSVAELVLDQYYPDAYAQFGNKGVDAREAVRWPQKLSPRSIRGGNWIEPAEKSRSAARYQTDDDAWKEDDPNIPLSPWWFTLAPARGVGMRIVRPLAPLTADEQKRAWEIDVVDVREDVEERIREGRGVVGNADKDLPAAVKAAEKFNAE